MKKISCKLVLLKSEFKIRGHVLVYPMNDDRDKHDVAFDEAATVFKI